MAPYSSATLQDSDADKRFGSLRTFSIICVLRAKSLTSPQENYTALYHTRKCPKKIDRASGKNLGRYLWYNPHVKAYREGSRLAPPPTALPTLLNDNLQAHRLLAADAAVPASLPSATVVVAVSGGADSMALLHGLVEVCVLTSISLHVAHFDHSLRPDSGHEAAFVAATAARLGLPFYLRACGPGELKNSGSNLEQAARAARYAFLCDVARGVTPRNQAPTIMTAHHALDQAETVLFHVVRGSGLAGLGGMRWSTWLHNEGERAVRLARPLLDVDPDLLRAYLLAKGITWQDDPSNSDTGLARNRLRHEILPALAELNPQVVAALGRLAEVSAGDAERLEAMDEALLQTICLEADGTRYVFDLDELLKLPRAAQRGVVRLALAELTGSMRELHFTPLEQLLDALPEHTYAGGPHTLFAGLAWSVVAGAEGAHLSIHRADATPASARGPQLAPDESPRPIAPLGRLTLGGWSLSCRRMTGADLPEDWRSPNLPWRAFIDGEQISAAGLCLIAWRDAPAGARFAPLGLGGRHKQIGDLFTDHKIPPAHRRGWPLVIDGATQEILWVCGLQPSHVGRITATTQQVIELCWSEHKKE